MRAKPSSPHHQHDVVPGTGLAWTSFPQVSSHNAGSCIQRHFPQATCDRHEGGGGQSGHELRHVPGRLDLSYRYNFRVFWEYVHGWLQDLWGRGSIPAHAQAVPSPCKHPVTLPPCCHCTDGHGPGSDPRQKEAFSRGGGMGSFRAKVAHPLAWAAQAHLRASSSPLPALPLRPEVSQQCLHVCSPHFETIQICRLCQWQSEPWC